MKDEKKPSMPVETESRETSRVPFFAKKIETESFRVKSSVKAGEASAKQGVY